MIDISKEICMKTVPEYAKNFLFCTKKFGNFFFELYIILIDIWFCIFTVSRSCKLHPWPSNCLVHELSAVKSSKKQFKHCFYVTDITSSRLEAINGKFAEVLKFCCICPIRCFNLHRYIFFLDGIFTYSVNTAFTDKCEE